MLYRVTMVGRFKIHKNVEIPVLLFWTVNLLVRTTISSSYRVIKCTVPPTQCCQWTVIHRKTVIIISLSDCFVFKQTNQFLSILQACRFMLYRPLRPDFTCTVVRPVTKFRSTTDHMCQCFWTFVRPRPGKSLFFFHKTRARPQQIYSLVTFQFFFKFIH